MAAAAAGDRWFERPTYGRRAWPYVGARVRMAGAVDVREAAESLTYHASHGDNRQLSTAEVTAPLGPLSRMATKPASAAESMP